MIKSFNIRVIIILSVFGLILIASGLLIYRTANSIASEALGKSSFLLAKSVEDVLVNNNEESLNVSDLSARRKSRLRRVLSGMATRSGNILNILLIDSSMTIILSNDPKVEGSVYHDEEQIKIIHQKEPAYFERTWEGGVQVLDVITPIMNEQQQIYAYLRVVLSRQEIESTISGLPGVLIPVLIAFGVLIVVSLIFVTRAYTQPLSSLKTALTKLNEEDYSFRVKYHQRDEFTDTFKKLNRTIEKVGFLNDGYKKAEKRIALLLQAVNEAIVLLDADKQVTSFNESAVKLFNLKSDAFRDDFHRLLSENIQLNQLIRDCLNRKIDVQDKAMVIYLKENQEKFYKVSLQRLSEDDNFIGLILTFKDMELLGELENNLLRSMKFGVITNLASSISHEIKNPLSALALHAEILDGRVRKAQVADKPKVLKSLDTIQNEVKRLNRIIEQFLSLARPSRLELGLIDLNKIVKDVQELVFQQAQEQKVVINSRYDESLDKVYGDEDQLKQVLLNILLNAFSAMNDGGKIYIRTRAEDKRACIDVRDTGNGIPENIREQIFDLYFTTKNDGGGIGLAICKNIMEMHEGNLSFDSVVNKGTIFTMDLPTKDYATRTGMQSLKTRKLQA